MHIRSVALLFFTSLLCACAALVGLDEPRFESEEIAPPLRGRDAGPAVTEDGAVVRTIETLATTAVPPRDLFVFRGDVFFTSAVGTPRENHIVGRVAKGGGSVVAIAPPGTVLEPTTGIHVDDRFVYVPAYAAGSGPGARRISHDGVVVEPFDDCNTTWSLIGDATHVYWFTGSCGGTPVMKKRSKADPDAGTTWSPRDEALWTGQLSYAELGYIGDDADSVYAAGASRIVAYDKDTLQNARVVVENLNLVRAIVVGDRIYARAGADILAIEKTAGTSTPLVTGLPERSGPDGGSGPRVHVRMALDALHVYFTTDGLGKVMRVPRAGGAAEVLAEDQPQPQGIALDEAHVYWSNAGDNTIKRTQR
jgi:hypothetical protein